MNASDEDRQAPCVPLNLYLVSEFAAAVLQLVLGDLAPEAF
jgi:hypothetical protein